jgi:hypothetical protein
MAHADDLIREIHAELLPIYPAIPTCLDLADEDPTDFGNAHYWGLTTGGCARLTFDSGKTPPRGYVVHELCHAAHDNAGGTPFGMFPDDPVLVGYWRAMRYTTTLEAAIAQARGIERQGASAAWPYYPGEQMADAFAWLRFPAQGWGGADPGIYGGSYDNDHLISVDEFFRGLRPEVTSMAITQDEWQQIDDRIKHHIADYANRLQVELQNSAYVPLAEVQRRITKAGGDLSGAA